MGRGLGSGAPNVPQIYTDMAWDLVEILTYDREARGIAPGRIQNRMGVSSSSLHRWEHGEGLPPVAALCGWADALGWDLVLIPREER